MQTKELVYRASLWEQNLLIRAFFISCPELSKKKKGGNKEGVVKDKKRERGRKG